MSMSLLNPILRLIFLIIVFNLNATNVLCQNIDWALRIGSTGSDFARKVVTDQNNNFYVYGLFNGTLTLDSAGSPKTLISSGSRDYFLLKYNCNRVLQWRVKVGGTGNDGGQFAWMGLDIAADGDLFISGTFTGTSNFVSSNFSNFTSKTSVGDLDIFTARLNNAGVFQWVASSGSSGWDEGTALVVDANKNVYTTGFFSGTCTFKPQSGVGGTAIASSGSTDLFVTKHDVSGNLSYAVKASGGGQDIGNDIKVDDFGNAYIAGNYSCCGSGSTTFGTTVLNNIGSWGGFVAKLNSFGAWQWANGMGASGDESFSKLVIDKVNGFVYANGHSNSNTTVTSQSPGLSQFLTIAGGYDVVTAKFDLNGSLIWAKNFGGTGNDFGWGITMNNNGYPIIVGEFTGTNTFLPLSSMTASGTADVYLVKLDINGIPQTKFKAGGTGAFTTCFDIHLNNSGVAYITGYFNGTTNFGTSTLISAGSEDAYVAKFTDNDTTILVADRTLINCGDSAKLTVINKTGAQFIWFRDNNLITTTTSNFIYVKQGGTYKVVNINNCVIPDTSNFIVLTAQPLIVDAGPNKAICSGDSVTLNGVSNIPGATYTWLPTSGLNNATILQPKTGTTTSKWYQLNSSFGGCTATDSVLVNVGNVTLNIGSNKTICFGDSAQVTATSNAPNFAWTPTTNISNPAILNPKIGSTITRYYKLVASDGACNKTDSILVTINNPTVDAGVNKNICFGDSVVLTATSNTPNLNWSPANGLSSTSVLQPNASPASTQYYYLTATQGLCSVIDSVIVNVGNVTLNIGSNKTICFGDSAQITATSNAPNFAWTPTTSVNNATILNPKIGSTLTRYYKLVANDGICFKTDSIWVTVNNPTVDAGVNKSLCFGDSVVLTATSNTPNLNWTPANGLSSTIVMQPNASPASTQYYYLTATQGLCSVIDSVLVNVTQVTLNIGSNKTICGGDSTQITAISNANSFNWLPVQGVNYVDSLNPKIASNSTKYYKLIATINNCSKTDSVLITVNTITVDAGLNQTVCIGDSVQLNATTNGTSFSWSPAYRLSNSAVLNPKVLGDSVKYYYLTATFNGCTKTDSVLVNVNGTPVSAGLDENICSGQSVQLQASGGGTYLWSPNYKINNVNISNPIVSPDSTTKYVVKVTNGTCAKYDTATVFVTIATANAGLDTMICLGDSVQILGTVNGTNYWWQPNYNISSTIVLNPTIWPTVDTTYYLSVQTGACFYTDTIKINVKTQLNVYAGLDKEICEGEKIQITASGANSYLWLTNYQISNTNIFNPFVDPKTDTAYIVMGNIGTCFGYDTVEIKVKNFPQVDAGLNVAYCKNNSEQFSGLVNGATSFVWRQAFNLSDSLILNPTVSGNNSAWYYLHASNLGCNAYDSVYAFVSQGVIASFFANPTSGFIPLNVSFLNQSSANAINYFWNFGNGNTATTKDANQIYLDSGRFVVRLIVTDSVGCADTAYQNIDVLKDEGIKLPNVFTPNGDGINEVFKAAYTESSFVYVKIFTYSRWGELLHEAIMPGGNWWDGTYKGTFCPEGVYFYIMDALSISGKNYGMHGTITLLK